MKRAFFAMLLLAVVALPSEREPCGCCRGRGHYNIPFHLWQYVNIGTTCYFCRGWGYVPSEFSRNTDPNPPAVPQ